MVKSKTKFKLKPWMIAGIILIALSLLLIILRSPEDGWIKGSDGVWVMHGNASSTPIYVQEQHAALSCATNLRVIQGLRGVGNNYECLGNCGAYAVDLVHVPRTESDNLAENQCNAYINGTLKKFIEITDDGKIFRVVE